jgi:hypothetical protein
MRNENDAVAGTGETMARTDLDEVPFCSYSYSFYGIIVSFLLRSDFSGEDF